MPLRPKSTKVFGARAVGFMVTDPAGNQSVVPFAEADDIYPTDGEAGVVPPYPSDPGGTNVYILVLQETNNYAWVNITTVGPIGNWSVLTDGDATQPELIFASGDVIMTFTQE